MRVLIFYEKENIDCKTLVPSIENLCFEYGWEFNKIEPTFSTDLFTDYNVSTDNIPYVIVFDDEYKECFNEPLTNDTILKLKGIRLKEIKKEQEYVYY